MFAFLKYIKPLWYFRAFDLGKGSNLDLFESLLKTKSPHISKDSFYKTEQADIIDQLYQALTLGFVPHELKNTVKSDLLLIENISDNYRFVAKYFPRNKLFYCFALRLVTFNNPIREFICLCRALTIKNIDIFTNNFNLLEFNNFQSPIIESEPLVSIIIPTLNRYDYLRNVLNDLEKQDYNNFEVIVCDQSDMVNFNFYKQWNFKIRLIQQNEKALWLARNNSIKLSNSEFILLTEDDVLLPSDWITNHLKCLDFFNCDISAGIFYPQGKSIEKSQSFFKLADHLATGNVGFRRSVFQRIGLFDRQFEKMRMGDGEFGLRALISGLKSVANPLAYCIDVKAPTGGLREMGSWDSLRPTNLFAPRPVPSVLYLSRKYFGIESSIYYLIQNIPFSFIPYKFKKSKILKLIFLFILPLLIPLILYVVFKSWCMATKMLNQGDKIDFLED
jgi:glycosyltransferase involved in cell wall biosynthesis